MTPIEMQELYHYNSWAHRRLFNVIAPLPVDLYMQKDGTSHGSLHGTITHTVGAEEIWFKRWTGRPVTGICKPEEFADFAAIRDHWESIDKKINEFCASLVTEESLRTDIAYYDLKGNKYSQPLVQLMQHLVNHSSYHRGQMAVHLRLFSVVPASTDMVVYFREKASGQNSV
jgi:uncharacterized damage-inducible protein DinB